MCDLLLPLDTLDWETSSFFELWLNELTLGDDEPLLLVLWLVCELFEDAVEYAVDVGSLPFAYGLKDPLVGLSYGDCGSDGGLNDFSSSVSAK